MEWTNDLVHIILVVKGCKQTLQTEYCKPIISNQKINSITYWIAWQYGAVSFVYSYLLDIVSKYESIQLRRQGSCGGKGVSTGERVSARSLRIGRRLYLNLRQLGFWRCIYCWCWWYVVSAPSSSSKGSTLSTWHYLALNWLSCCGAGDTLRVRLPQSQDADFCSNSNRAWCWCLVIVKWCVLSWMLSQDDVAASESSSLRHWS